LRPTQKSQHTSGQSTQKARSIGRCTPRAEFNIAKYLFTVVMMMVVVVAVIVVTMVVTVMVVVMVAVPVVAVVKMKEKMKEGRKDGTIKEDKKKIPVIAVGFDVFLDPLLGFFFVVKVVPRGFLEGTFEGVFLVVVEVIFHAVEEPPQR
jgi:hypothetical protein